MMLFGHGFKFVIKFSLSVVDKEVLQTLREKFKELQGASEGWSKKKIQVLFESREESVGQVIQLKILRKIYGRKSLRITLGSVVQRKLKFGKFLRRA